LKISDRGLNELIKPFEGYLKKLPDGRCTTYRCPANVLTIGYGCTEGITEGMVWTEQEATEALAREMLKHEQAVEKMLRVPVSQEQFDALVSLSYNVGAGAVGRSTLLRHLNAGDYARAASHFADFKRSRVYGALAKRYGVKDGERAVLPGLVRRRAAEAALFLEGTDREMPQRVEPADTKMKLPDVMKRVVAPVAAGGAVVGEVVQQGVPAVPEVVSKSVEHVGAWRGVGTKVMGIWTEVAGLPWQFLAVAGAAGAVLAFLKIRERQNESEG
jgi:lysozyme